LAKCPRCGKEYDLYIDLKDIKVLPHLWLWKLNRDRK
jgi:hypothetical protein